MKLKKGINYFFQEIIIVVIGVVIAVSIGDYKERIDDEKYIETTLSAIENEIKSSQSSVDEILLRHINLLDSIEGHLDESDLPLGQMVADFGGGQFPVIKNVSLRFFISNKAELVEFKTISQLLEIEDNTNLLSDKMGRLADFAYNHLNDSEKDAKIIFAYMLSDVIDSEQTLLELYDGLLEKP